MSIGIKLKQFQLVFLKLYAGCRELSQEFSSYKPLRPTLGWNPSLGEIKRKRDKNSLDLLYRRIRYLKNQGYIQLIKEEEQRLYRLTSKGKYELLRLRFINQTMNQQKEEPRNRKCWVVIFDIPEHKRKFRDFFRRFLKENNFKMWQYSVWVAPFDPNPALNEILDYLGLKNFFALLEIDRDKLSCDYFKKFKF